MRPSLSSFYHLNQNLFLKPILLLLRIDAPFYCFIHPVTIIKAFHCFMELPQSYSTALSEFSTSCSYRRFLASSLGSRVASSGGAKRVLPTYRHPLMKERP